MTNEKYQRPEPSERVGRRGRAPAPPPPFPEPIDWTDLEGTPPHRELALGLWCPLGRATVIHSPAKAGKSELVMHDAVEELQSDDDLVVLYLDKEMDPEDLRERKSDLGATAAQLERLKYFLYPSLPRLDEPGGGEYLLSLCRHWMGVLAVGKAVVVFDTARRFVAGEENENDTWQRFWEYTGSVLKREGVTWVRIDHTGKDKSRGARGASAKNDDVDVVWELSRIEGGTRLRLTHSRVSWLPPQIDYVRDEEPVRYRQAMFGLPSGTLEIAALLDRLNVPTTAANTLARKVIREAGHSARNDVVAAAVKHRKHLAEKAGTAGISNSEVGNEAGNAHFSHDGEHQGNARGTNRETPGSEPGTPRGTTGNDTSRPWGTSPPSKEGNVPGPHGEQDIPLATPLPSLNDDQPRRPSKRPLRRPVADDADNLSALRGTPGVNGDNAGSWSAAPREPLRKLPSKRVARPPVFADDADDEMPPRRTRTIQRTEPRRRHR